MVITKGQKEHAHCESHCVYNYIAVTSSTTKSCYIHVQQNKDGFMGKFYLLSEVLTPVMAWGFLGTDLTMQQHCQQLKVYYN